MDFVGITLNGKYRIVESAAEGSFSSLYHGVDIENGIGVSIKLLKASLTSRRIQDVIRFQSEIDRMILLVHPNIVRVLDRGELFERLYVVTESVKGSGLAKILAGGSLDITEALDTVRQIATALEFLHAHSILHRDLRPENIVIEDNRTTRITEVGLAHIKDFSEMFGGTDITGTLAYLSPEQCGLLNREVDERSDLFSLGVIMYQTLTGKLPFTGEDIFSLVHSQMARAPAPPSHLNRSIPVEADRVVLKLLDKDPAERYQSARGLIADLEKLADGQTGFLPGINDRSIRLVYHARMIGRETELGVLREGVLAAMNGEGSVCLIRGAAGTGKTRLADELRDFVIGKGSLVIEGRCVMSENKIPYGPFREALTSYMNHFNSYRRSRKEEIRAKVAAEFATLARIITGLNPDVEAMFDDIPPLKNLDGEKENQRFLMAAAHFFEFLSGLEKGMVLVIDDVQWADEGSLALLKQMASLVSKNAMLLVIISREKSAGEEEACGPLPWFLSGDSVPVREIMCREFEGGMISRLAAGILSESEENLAQVASFVHEKSRGNPFFAIEILKQLVEGKCLTYRGGRWQADTDIEKMEFPPSLVDIIFERTSRLDARERELITLASVVGNEFDPGILYRISGLEPAQVVEVMDHAIALQIFREGPPSRGTVAFAHDRIREAFYRSIDQESKRKLHLQIANALEEQNIPLNDSRIFSLAYHYIEAGDSEKSVEYAFPAGIMAKESFAHDDAARYFKKTLELLESSGSHTSQLWIDCSMELGSIYVTTGKYDQAISMFDGLIPRVKGSSVETIVYKHISDAYYRRGEWQKCEDYVARGLALAGESLPRSGFVVVLGAVKELVIHFLHDLIPGVLTRSAPGPQAARYRLILSFYDSLGMTYILTNPLKLVYTLLKALNIAERHIGPSPELSMGLYAYASLYMSLGFFPIAHRYFQRARDLLERNGYEWEKSKSLELYAYCLEWEAQFDAAAERFQKCAEAFERIGDIKEYAMSLNGLEHCRYYRGDYAGAFLVNDRYYEICNNIQDYYGIGAAEIYYSQLHRETGNLDRAVVYAGKARDLSRDRGIWFNYCSSLNEVACHAIETRDPGKAIVLLEEARALHEKNYFLKQYIQPIYVNLACAYIEDYILREGGLTSSERRRCRTRMLKAAKTAISKTKKWQTHHGGALRMMARCQALLNKNDRAAESFKKSIEQCARAGRRFEEALGYYHYGIFLSQKGDGPASRDNLARAYQILSDMDARGYAEKAGSFLGVRPEEGDHSPIRKLIQKERAQSIARFSQRIKVITDFEQLLEEIIGRALELAGARRGYLFLAADENSRLDIAASQNLLDSKQIGFAREMVESVFRSGEYSITAEKSAMKEPAPENRALCVPVKSGYRTIGVCYIDYPYTGRIFTGEDGEMLSDFLSQVGIAVENVMLHHYLRDQKAEDRDYITATTENKVKKAIAYIEENYMSDISREGLAAHLGINPDHLGKAFKIYTGEKISEHINNLRIRDAAQKLRETDDKIIDIAFSVGFESLSTFNRAFLKEMNVTPKDYRREFRR